MNAGERTLLLEEIKNQNSRPNGLSQFFAIICVIDVFGVFPLVTLPKAIIDCGLHGILVILVVCPVQIFTAILLGRCWVIAEEIYPMIHKKNRYPYSALAEITYGKHLSSFVTFLLDLTVFGGGIPNLIVASQNLQLLCLRISDDNINVSHCYWIIILGMVLCPLLWLGSPKDMKCICSLSVFMVFSVFFLTCGCLLFSGHAHHGDPTEELLNTENMPLWKSMLTTYGILAFQFDVHPTILTIQVDMKEKSKLARAVISGFIVTLSMFGIITIMASIKYGIFTQSSILGTLPSTIPLHFAAALIALQLCLTSAVSNNALYQHMEDCLCISRGPINVELHLHFLDNFVVPILKRLYPNNDSPNQIDRNIWFQQNGVPSQFAVEVSTYLNAVFPGRWIDRRGRIEWPPRFLEISPLDYFLYDYTITFKMLFQNYTKPVVGIFDRISMLICYLEINIKRCVLRSILTLLAVVLAELIPRFDVLMSFIGGTLTGPLIFVLPPLLYIKILALQTKHEEELAMLALAKVFSNGEDFEGLSNYMEQKFSEDFRSLSLMEKSSKWICNKNFEKVVCLLIIVFSSFTTIATTYLNFTNMVLSYSVFTEPCIYNISSALLSL